MAMQWQDIPMTMPWLHSTIDTCIKYVLLRTFDEQGSPLSTKKLPNGVDTARHGLMLCQHGATACTELLETNFYTMVISKCVVYGNHAFSRYPCLGGRTNLSNTIDSD